MNDLQILRPQRVQNIINKFCWTIGMIPTSYKVSMTYEEQILAIGHYLETTVYPAINNNAEALAELQGLFVELKEYVENYFDNLDIQEEVDNKLEEMLESGELAELISSYLQMSGLIIYNTVNDMINAENLIEGTKIKTLGYYSINDGGGANYIIKDSIQSYDEYIIISENLYAVLVPEKNTIFLKQFGAVGDGETSEENIINRFFSYPANNYVVNNGNYLIDGDIDGFTNNSNISFENAKITRKTNNLTNYYMFKVQGKHDITFNNIHLKGDKTTHTGTEGEWGHCLYIIESSNIEVNNAILEEAWGDGIYVGYSYYIEPSQTTENITINNCQILNNSRNGIALGSGDNIKVTNNYIYGTNRTNPKAGIDIEPEHSNSNVYHLSNVLIENNITENNYQGIDITLNCDVNLIRIKDHSSFNEFMYNITNNNVSKIDIINSYSYNTSGRIITIDNMVNGSELNLFNTIAEGTQRTDSTNINNLVFLDTTSHDLYNISVRDLKIKNNSNTIYSTIRTANSNSNKVYNLTLENIDKTPYLYYGVDIDFTTLKTNYIKENISNYYTITIGGGSTFSNKFILTNVNQTIYRILKNTLPDGEYEFDVLSRSSGRLDIDLTDFSNVYFNGALTQNKTFRMNAGTTGNMKIKIINNTVYTVSYNGTWSAA